MRQANDAAAAPDAAAPASPNLPIVASLGDYLAASAQSSAFDNFPPFCNLASFAHVDHFIAYLQSQTLRRTDTVTILAPDSLQINEFLILANVVNDALANAKFAIFDESHIRFAVRDELGMIMLWDLSGDVVRM